MSPFYQIYPPKKVLEQQQQKKKEVNNALNKMVSPVLEISIKLEILATHLSIYWRTNVSVKSCRPSRVQYVFAQFKVNEAIFGEKKVKKLVSQVIDNAYFGF